MAINYVDQGSSKDGRHPWFELTPELDGLTLSIPTWTFRASGREWVLPTDSHAFGPDPDHDTSVAIFLTPTGYEVQTMVLDGLHSPPPLPTPLNANQGAPRVVWFTLPQACEELTEVGISVLRSVER